MSVSRGHLPPTRGGSSKPFWACFPPLRAGRDCHVTYELASTALPTVLAIGPWRRIQKLVWFATGKSLASAPSPWSISGCHTGCLRGAVDAAVWARHSGSLDS